MVDPIKSCTSQSARSEPPAHSPMHYAVYGTRTEVHHRYPDLSDKQTGWLEDTTAFHKSSKTNRHQALKHLRQYWCYGNWAVIGDRRGRWTFRNWGDISLSPQLKMLRNHLERMQPSHGPEASCPDTTRQGDRKMLPPPPTKPTTLPWQRGFSMGGK